MNLNLFDGFINSLGSEGSLWNDFHLQISSELLEKFSTCDWLSLKRELLVRPVYWQERCAEAIGYLDNQNGVDVLKALLDSPNISVAAIAASELDNMDIGLSFDFKDKLERILISLVEKHSSRSDDVRRLLDRIPGNN